MRRLTRWFRVRLLAGVLVLFPLAITAYASVLLFRFLDGFLGPLVSAYVTRKYVPGVGVAALLLLVLLVGVLVRSFVGRRIIALYEAIVDRLPFARSVYGGAKQLTQALSQSGRSFRKVVLVEFPRPGSYAVGFVTCDGVGEVQARTPGFVTNVFIPTTPNPTSGFLIMVPRDSLISLDMGVEDAIKLIVSGGLVAPAWSGDHRGSDPRLVSASAATVSTLENPRD